MAIKRRTYTEAAAVGCLCKRSVCVSWFLVDSLGAHAAQLVKRGDVMQVAALYAETVTSILNGKVEAAPALADLESDLVELGGWPVADNDEAPI